MTRSSRFGFPFFKISNEAKFWNTKRQRDWSKVILLIPLFFVLKTMFFNPLLIELFFFLHYFFLCTHGQFRTPTHMNLQVCSQSTTKFYGHNGVIISKEWGVMTFLVPLTYPKHEWMCRHLIKTLLPVRIGNGRTTLEK